MSNYDLDNPSSSRFVYFCLFSTFFPSVRCLNLVPHQRPSPSALDCWNTHRWRGSLRWRHVRMPSSMSCASPTHVCPADENYRSSSTSAPLVSLPALLCLITCTFHFMFVLTFVFSAVSELSIQPQLNSTLIPPHARAQTSPASHGLYPTLAYFFWEWQTVWLFGLTS